MKHDSLEPNFEYPVPFLPETSPEFTAKAASGQDIFERFQANAKEEGEEMMASHTKIATCAHDIRDLLAYTELLMILVHHYETAARTLAPKSAPIEYSDFLKRLESYGVEKLLGIKVREGDQVKTQLSAGDFDMEPVLRRILGEMNNGH